MPIFLLVDMHASPAQLAVLSTVVEEECSPAMSPGSIPRLDEDQFQAQQGKMQSDKLNELRS
jgi:hypothetical protein